MHLCARSHGDWVSGAECKSALGPRDCSAQLFGFPVAPTTICVVEGNARSASKKGFETVFFDFQGRNSSKREGVGRARALQAGLQEKPIPVAPELHGPLIPVGSSRL